MAQPQQQNHENLRAEQNHWAVRTINNKTNCAYRTYMRKLCNIRVRGFNIILSLHQRFFWPSLVVISPLHGPQFSGRALVWSTEFYIKLEPHRLCYWIERTCHRFQQKLISMSMNMLIFVNGFCICWITIFWGSHFVSRLATIFNSFIVKL